MVLIARYSGLAIIIVLVSKILTGSLAGLGLLPLAESLASEDGKENLDGSQGALGYDLVKSLHGVVTLTEYGVRELHVVLDDLTKSSKHGNTAVLQLGSAVPGKGLGLRVVGEALSSTQYSNQYIHILA